MDQQTGKLLLVVGCIIVVVGLVVYFGGNHLRWLGRLPGDIRVERENFRFYFPIVTMLLVSILLTVIVNIIKRFF